ncbi:MAG: nucleotide exchange factor GrpE [Gammaproteobacteria bacterium]|nr:nucleotide exchange factor GrpE [Gammaproteobacteria bacterium]
MDKARRQAEENWNKLVRLQAEMDNLRKRTSRDVEHAHKYALDKFVAELLPVIDSLELGISAADDSSEADSLREGMELTLKKFLDVLSKFGVQPINPQGDKFNPRAARGGLHAGKRRGRQQTR